MTEEKTLTESLEENWDEISNYYKMLEEETDMGAAILAFSNFEEQLKRTVNLRVEGFENVRMRVQNYIEIAYALGVYDQDTRKGLRLVAKIRNKFAHAQQRLFFDNPEIVNWWRNIRPDDDLANFRETFLNYVREVEVRLREKEFELRACQGSQPGTESNKER